MNKDNEDLDNISCSFDNKNILDKNLPENEEDNTKKIRKSKTLRNSTKTKLKKSIKKSRKEVIERTRKVKFIDEAVIIDVECWKRYNLEQTADENFDAFFMDFDKEDKDNSNKGNRNNTNGNKKLKDRKDNVSCTCNII